MSIGWIKDKFGRRVYAYSHEKAVLCGDDGKTKLEAKLKEFLTKNGTAADANKLGGQDAAAYVKRSEVYLSTSILAYALTCPEGVTEVRLGGTNYTGNDLPDSNYIYGNATIHRRLNFITVTLHPVTYLPGCYCTINAKDDAAQWNEWKTNVSADDPDDFVQLDGGYLASSIKVKPFATTGTKAVGLTSFSNYDGLTVGAVGALFRENAFQYIYISATGTEPYYSKNGLAVHPDNLTWKDKDVLHKGNSAPVIFTASDTTAPADGDALWAHL